MPLESSLEGLEWMGLMEVIPGVSKGCCLEVFEYLRASKKHFFVTPGSFFFVFWVSCYVAATVLTVRVRFSELC